MEYTNENGIVTVEGYTGGSGNVDLEKLFPDATEIIIENWAFYESNLASITIPKTVSSIGELAFCNCENLQTVTFEERTTETITFGISAFQGCSSLRELDISGLNVTAEYTEGEGTRKEEVAIEDCTFSSFNSSKVGEQIITVSYGGQYQCGGC